MAAGRGENTPSGVGSLIKQYRSALGLTQRELAYAAGVSVGALRDVEQGRTGCLRWEGVENVAAVLGIDEAQRAELMRASRRGFRSPGIAAPSRPPGSPGPGRDVRFQVLGQVAVVRRCTQVSLGSIRQRTVLGLLALQHGVGVHRASIIDVLWGPRPPASALAMVEGYVWRLRQALGPGRERCCTEDFIVTTGNHYLLKVTRDQLDLAAFQHLVRRAGEAEVKGNPARACELLESALELWRGDVLADVESLRNHPAVVAIDRQRSDAIMRYAANAIRIGAGLRALPHVRSLCSRESLNEEAHAYLMIVLAAEGQQAAALQVYLDLRDRLDEELGVRPGRLISATYARILCDETADD